MKGRKAHIKGRLIMQHLLENYIAIILAQSTLLLEPGSKPLTELQKNSIVLIDRYSQELNRAVKNSENLSELEMQRFVRHELLNILTPIVGYIEMLADGWIGRLSPDQSAHVEIISYAVQDVLSIIASQKILPALAS
jgi:hypothetical protein